MIMSVLKVSEEKLIAWEVVGRSNGADMQCSAYKAPLPLRGSQPRFSHRIFKYSSCPIVLRHKVCLLLRFSIQRLTVI